MDRALERVLRQKAELGLLDARFDGPAPEVGSLDPAAHRAIARRLAEEAVILLANDGILPLAAPREDRRHRAERRPRATPCSAATRSPNHVLDHYPDVPLGIDVPTVLDALTARVPGAARSSTPRGAASTTRTGPGSQRPWRPPADADVAIVVAGDRAGLFGRGTSGEGCDADSLELPGRAARRSSRRSSPPARPSSSSW